MYDQPALTQLLDAVRAHLENQVVPAVKEDRKLYYQTLVAINVLHIVRREMEFDHEHIVAEWASLNYVQNVTTPLPSDWAAARAALAERNRTLCEQIAAGYYDYEPRRAALFEHLLSVTHNQLEVSSPKFLQALAIEDEKRDRTR